MLSGLQAFSRMLRSPDSSYYYCLREAHPSGKTMKETLREFDWGCVQCRNCRLGGWQLGPSCGLLQTLKGVQQNGLLDLDQPRGNPLPWR